MLFRSYRPTIPVGCPRWRAIEDIQPGWLVYTHRRRWRPVTETMSHATWPTEIVLHLGGDKTLVVTDDHPILTRRGWVAAGDLTVADDVCSLASPCKHCGRWTRGARFCSRACKHAAARVHRVCEACGNDIPTRGKKKNRRFCSQVCMARGMRRVPVRRCLTCDVPMVSTWKRPFSRARRFCSMHCWHAFKGETAIERVVREWMEAVHIEFAAQRQIGRYTVDFVLPHYNIGIEVDGSYWHRPGSRSHARSLRREMWLRSHGLTLVYLSEDAVRSRRFAKTVLEAIRGATLTIR